MTQSDNEAVLLEPSIILGRKSQVRIEADRDTIERQFADGERYAERHDPPLTVIVKLADEESGYKAKSKNARPALRESLRMIEEGEAKHLIVARLDRLTRQGPKSFLDILDRINKAGGKLHILDIPGLGALDTSSGIGQGILALLAGVASEWSERTSKNVKRAELESASQGKRHGGRRPYGWHQASKTNGEQPCPSCGEMMEQDEVRGRLVAKVTLCPVESEILREAAQRVAGGTTLRQIVLDFNRRGIKTASGKLWATATLGRALRSPGISGKRTHLGIEYEGAFPPILTPEEHAPVLAALETNGKGRPPGKQALLSGLGVLYCECGVAMVSAIPSRPNQPARYRCIGTNPGYEGCGKTYAVQTGVDKTVIAKAITALEHWKNKSESPEPTEYETLSLKLSEDREALTDLTKAMYVSRSLNEESFRAAYEPLKTRVEETEALLEALKPPVVQDQNKMTPDANQSVQEWWDSKELKEKRAILKYYVHKVTVLGATGKGPVFNTKRVRVQWNWAFVQTFTGEELSPDEEAEAIRSATR